MDPDAQEAIQRLYREPIKPDEGPVSVWLDDEDSEASSDSVGASDDLASPPLSPL